MGNIEDITAEILCGYASVLQKTNSQLIPDTNISLEQYLNVREIAKKERYLQSDMQRKELLSDEPKEVFYREKEDMRYNIQDDLSHHQREHTVLSRIQGENQKDSVVTSQKTMAEEYDAPLEPKEDAFDESAIFASLEE